MIMARDRKNSAISVDSSLSSRTVTSRIAVSGDLKKYFRRLAFFSNYDAEIFANKSILAIPVLSMVLPVAWITGADVYVDEIDRTFAESAEVLQWEYRKMYPGAPFRTRLIADRVVDNEYASNKTALLFSGGLDSIYSLSGNLSLKPMLVMILGTDIPISEVAYQNAVEREYSDFAGREGLAMTFVRTDALGILDTRRLDYLFWRFQGRFEAGFLFGIGYSLTHIGQTAPLSVGRFNRVLVAASNDEAKAHQMREYPDSSYPAEKITWANIRVELDGPIARHEKALALKGFLKAHRFRLRPCWYASDLYSEPTQSPLLRDTVNCNVCEKCLRTIAALALAGIDPNEYGFLVNKSTFDRMKGLFQRRLMTRQHIEVEWRPLQEAIPVEMEEDPYGVGDFFRWLHTIDLRSSARPYESLRSKLYHRLPYPIADLLRVVWEKTPPQRLLVALRR